MTITVPSAVRAGGLREAITHTWYMTDRQFRVFFRQPAYLIITLIQPVIWLFLFGQLFRNVADLPGFGAGSYLDYLVPGVVVMNAVSANMWAGMGVLEEIDRGTLNRFLVTPLRRSALVNANVVAQGCSTAFQSLVMIALGRLGGAHYPGGVVGILVLIVVSSILGTIFGAFSNALGMVARQRETVIALNTFLLLPLTFLSSAFLPAANMPHWIRVIARFNPLDWALRSARSAMRADPDWAMVAERGAALVALAAFAVWLSMRTFRVYRKSV
ncbi:ABC transporter permease [Embleya sp. AB8]|uniref:ABC transporter permease n=1 Tax=Embleya sp. AB8 TaxID=3156304 RepID=UPI003C7075F9